MPDASSPPSARPPRAPLRWQPLVEIALVLAVFAIHASVPIPDSNEPHYLAKARHHWDPEWCPGDFFLESADAHQVFYYAFGWLARFLTLPEMACFGRVLTWGLLAWSGRRLSRAIVPRPWFSVLSAALFVALSDRLHMAGEWVVGGVEAKGFAYVFVFLALEAIVRNRWNQAGWFLGAATSLHVLVGGWAAVAALVVWLADRAERPRIASLWPGVLGFLLLALPGVWLAGHMTLVVDHDTIDANLAHEVYVYQRLPHHLSPYQFADGFIARHLALWCIWLLLCTVTPADSRTRRLRWFVGSAMGLAVIGFVIATVTTNYPALGGWLLRFYWFRLSDAMVPVGVSLGLLSYILWLRDTRPRLARFWLTIVIAVAAAHLTLQGVHDATDLPRGDKFAVDEDSWRNACRWIDEHTPPDARFLTPRFPGSFHWYANRAEVGTWKDVPQDPGGIVAWWQRMQDLHATQYPAPFPQWRDSLAQLGPELLSQLAAKYKADYALIVKVPGQPPLPWTPLFENAGYAVYKIDQSSQ